MNFNCETLDPSKIAKLNLNVQNVGCTMHKRYYRFMKSIRTPPSIHPQAIIQAQIENDLPITSTLTTAQNVLIKIQNVSSINEFQFACHIDRQISMYFKHESSSTHITNVIDDNINHSDGSSTPSPNTDGNTYAQNIGSKLTRNAVVVSEYYPMNLQMYCIDAIADVERDEQVHVDSLISPNTNIKATTQVLEMMNQLSQPLEILNTHHFIAHGNIKLSTIQIELSSIPAEYDISNYILSNFEHCRTIQQLQTYDYAGSWDLMSPEMARIWVISELNIEWLDREFNKMDFIDPSMRFVVPVLHDTMYPVKIDAYGLVCFVTYDILIDCIQLFFHSSCVHIKGNIFPRV